MPLSLGTRLGAYEVLAPIGAGGMGEVYLARDTRLDRDVAIKVLPAAVARDAERLLRFEREAKLLASLNHPNIAQVYGVEESGDTRALVMELVAGSTLSVPQPIDTALHYSRQIAEALEAAHEKGITHRDLKPANIMIRPDGVVKILDFGLATLPVREGGSDPANSPTFTMTATQAGMIMGTASYMSPEQAAGKAVDKRSDIWSFGVVLWEMLTGVKLFEGETLSHTLADVLRAPVDLGKLPESTPPAVRRLIGRCLERDVKQRLRDIGEARILLDQPFAPAPETAAAAPSRSWLAWGAAAVLFSTSIALAFVHFRETAVAAPLIRTYIPPPDRGFFNFTGVLGATGPAALSSDGHRMTFSAKSADGRSQLWVRAMDALTAQPLAGTEEAIHPFWSPDSRSIAFFAGGKLKKIDAFGGPPVTLCDAPSGRGGSWNEAGVIVFAPNGIAAGLQRVSASGGVPAKLDLDVAGRWPWFLPGGRNFLYSAGSTVRLGSVDSGKTSLLIETLSDAVYAQGHVLYLREGTLMAQPFDLKRLALIGEAVPVAENVKSVGAQRRGIFSVSQNGMLVYQSGVSGGSHVLTWFDRAGKRLGALGGASDLLSVMLSPDGKRAASSVLDPTGHAFDLWLYDIARDLRTRFTFHASRSYLPAVWSPDGSSIAFATYRDGKSAVFRKATDLSGSEELLCDDPAMYPTSWSSDGKTILMVKTTGGNAADSGIFALHLSGDRKPVAIAPAAVALDSPRFSPDGRWIAYGSIESQRAEIYVVPYSGLGGKLQISANGGRQARWRSDGKEIFYISPDGRLMAVQVKANTASLEVGRVQPLFANLPSRAGPNLYDVAPGGQRFLVDVQPERSVAEPLTLVQNWTAALKR